MSDSTVKPHGGLRSVVTVATFAAVLVVIAAAASLHPAASGSGFDLVTTISHTTWGAAEYSVPIAALLSPCVALAAPRGKGHE